MSEFRTIRELCSVVVDCPHSTPKWTANGKIVIRNKNIKHGKIDFSSPSYTDDEHFAQRIKRAKPQPGDIIITREAPIGDVGMIPENTECCLGQRMVLLRANQSVCDNFYLLYSLQSLYVQHQISWSEGTGTTVSNLRIPHLEQIQIPYLPLEQQAKISSVLRALEEKIENNRRLNDNLYEMVNAYYTSLFKESDCEMTTVGNYAERIYSGGTPMTSNAAYWNGTFGWFSSGETRNRFVISTEKTITQAGIDNSSTKLATKYDIVMASAGQGFTRGQISMLLIDTYVNQSVIVIKSERNILPYLFWNLVNRYDELRAISDSSSIRGSLTTKMIAAFEIPLAKAQSLQAFADFAWSVIHQIENNLLENERLTALRDSLLPKLMSGEIDVSDIQL